MISMTLGEAATAMQGQILGADKRFSGVSTDTRQLDSGELFFALVGENFDAHQLCGEAFKAGAAGAVVERNIAAESPLVKVRNTRNALGDLAKTWRAKHAAKAIGITGSNGKTTVKEMLAAILNPCGEVLSTRGNFNNDIGLPRTLFRLSARHQYLVLEMGANHAGEIARLADIARPDVAVITLCAPAHLEGFGSIEGVAAAKGEIFSSLGPDGVAIINADDAFHDFWDALAGARKKIKFGLKNNRADIYASDISHEKLGAGTSFLLHCFGETKRVKIPHDGIHNVQNALAAIAGAYALGCKTGDIITGLANSDVVSGRLNVHQLSRHVKLIDDTYNANPRSLMAAAEVALQEGDETWVILGDMGELGDKALSLHEDCGRAMAAAGVKRLLTVGELSAGAAAAFGEQGKNFESKDALGSELMRLLTDHKSEMLTILVKGSRSAKMEAIVALLRENSALNEPQQGGPLC